jgi:hypothetical protein
MSEYITSDEIENKLSLVVRKPQEGKTSICIASITKDQSPNIHIVLTMNTLASGMQFFGRMQQDVSPDKIVVFNSNKQSAGECHYAKSVTDVIRFIKNDNIKVIVCCAHVVRMRESLIELLDFATDSNIMIRSNIKFIIHIDEAHKYIPENISSIRDFNASPMVSEIIGYSATPNNIWTCDRNDPIFHKIGIRDVEKELSIIRSVNYFGVNRCDHHTYDYLNKNELVKEIPCEIPSHIMKLADMKEGINPRRWFGDNWCFDLGNEMLMMGFLNYILPTLKILPNRFSYYFAPAYTRKASQYQNVDIILKHYPTANVIVLNGNGYTLFRCNNEKNVIITNDEFIRESTRTLSPEKRKIALDKLLEPSYMIQKLISAYSNVPTFITGHTCVGMSVTFINPKIGNFDGVIMTHQHYSRDKLYQLCRFLFNYDKWKPESRDKIKKTQIYSLTKSVIDTCVEYEKHIERIITEFSGKSCSLREIEGLPAEEPTERDIKNEAFDKIQVNDTKMWKKFKVYDGNDDDMWEQAQQFYKSILGKRINGKSMPKKKEGYYLCSDSKGVGKKLATTFNNLDNDKWSSRFQLKKDCLSYAHVFVGYEKETDPNEYTIFIKYAQLVDTPETREYLSKYHDKKEKNESTRYSTDSVDSIQSDDSTQSDDSN